MSEHVLLLHSNSDVRFNLRIVLERGGFAVVEACNIQEAIKLAVKPLVTITEYEEFGPLSLTSANIIISDELLKVKAEADAYLSYPVSAHILLSTVKSWMLVKQAEREAKRQESIIESERQFQSLAESMPQIVWTARSDGFLDWYNQVWYDYTGSTFERGWENDEIVHPDDMEQTRKRWNQSIASGEFYENEYRLKRKSDGMYRWHLGRAVPIKDREGRVIKWFGTDTDIHEKTEAERILEMQNELFKKITEAIPQGIWRTNLDGSADYFSHRFSEIVGHKVEDMLAWGWFNFIHPDDQEKVSSEWQSCRECLIPVSFEFRVKQKDGSYKWFLSQGNPYRDVSGNVIKYYGTWTDIHEQKQAQEELSNAVNARDEFISIASHELKTPLTSLKLQSQMFSRVVRLKGVLAYDKERVDAFSEHIEKHTSRLTRLVDDMLDISRLRTGKMSIQKSMVEFTGLLEEVIERMRPHSLANISVIKPQDKIDILIDSLRIEQVISNLILNAIRYGNERPIEIRLEKTNNELLLHIKDEGMGISSEKISLIFDRFERAVSANEVSGLGLGLYISRQILQLHGGDIRVNSQMNKGSTFTAIIPLS